MAEAKRQITQRRCRKSALTPEFHRSEFVKYNTHCWYCGQELYCYPTRHRYPDQGTKDHLVPRSKGGRGPENLVPACYRCNTRKGDQTLEEYRFQRFGALGGLFWAEKHEQNYTRRKGAVCSAQSNMASANSSNLQLTMDTDRGGVGEVKK